MKISTILIGAGIIVTGFVSCKRDSSGSSDSKAFEGTWNFAGIHSETQAVVITTDDNYSGKDSTVSNYDSKDNTGTVKFAAGTATTTGLGYTVNMNPLNYSYMDGALVDTFSFPVSDTIPPSGSTSNYKLVGSDSVSFTGSGLVSDPENSTTVSGAHYIIEGNKMTLTTSVAKDSAATDGTTHFTMHETAKVKIYLEK